MHLKMSSQCVKRKFNVLYYKSTVFCIIVCRNFVPIRKGFSGVDGTVGNAPSPIHPGNPMLLKAMHMQRCSLVLEVVGEVDDNLEIMYTTMMLLCHYILTMLLWSGLNSIQAIIYVFHSTPCPLHDDVIKWKQFTQYWPFVRGIHWSPVNSPHKGQWRGALLFPLISAWTISWANNGYAGGLRRHRAHYDIIVMAN